ncbi:phage antirepressor KilAC domain-containing protein [Acinetobacter bereziniae]|uniref:phage antirepressor KilAC domain-containing protein n=1 Tax=Acinetobacter bereziniae TaxID=106648 RepID=UPI003AF7BCE3
MNALLNRNQNVITMSSLELVVFINKHREETATADKPYIQLQHSDFLKKVPLVLGEDAGKFSSTYKDGSNRDKPCYSFPKREACLMAMSYSYDLQARVFDQMTAMEEALNSKPIFDISNPHHLLHAIEIQSKQNIELTHKVEILEPKAQALDTIANTDGTYNIRECAKTIGIGERKLIDLLLEKKWIYREDSGRLQPYSTKREAGIFINRASPVVTNRYTGEEKVHLHMRVTAFGLTKITELVNTCFGKEVKA